MKTKRGFLSPNALSGITGALFIVSLIVRLWLTLFRYLNADEFQHLHAAWMVKLGYMPYRDFWDNHGPLQHFLLAPLLAILGEGIPAVLTIRILLSASALLILVVVYRLARMLYDQLTAALAVIILSYSEMFIQKTIEVRSDQFLALCWMISVWFCYRALRLEKRRTFVVAGLFLGLGLLFSPKALLCSVAAVIMLIYWQERIPRVRRSLPRQILFLGGFLLPVSCMGLFLYSRGILGDWFEHTILKNFTYPDTNDADFLYLPQNLGFLLLGIAGIVLSWNDFELRNRVAHESPLLMIIPAVLLLLIVMFLMPSVFPQSTLIFTPLFAIFAGFALRTSLEWKTERKATFLAVRSIAILAALVIPIVSLVMRLSVEKTNHAQFDLIRYVLNHTAPHETVFDGNSAYIFRKQAYYYGSLVDGVRHQLKLSQRADDIIESLRAQSCRIVLLDDRVSDLPSKVQDFIGANYLPAGWENAFIAGRRLDPEDLSHNRAVFRIEIPAVYTIYANGSNYLTIDGRRYEDAVFLEPGVHELISDQQLQNVIVRAEH